MPSREQSPIAPRRNIEIKVAHEEIGHAKNRCGQFATFSGHERQIDTYFQCSHGKLKLDRPALPSHLVAYARDDLPTPRASDYWLAPIANSDEVKAALTAALGVLVVVEKERDIFLYQNVRIHLDRVRDLGDFVEFEALVMPGDDEAERARLVTELAGRLDVDLGRAERRSYGDLLLVKPCGGR